MTSKAERDLARMIGAYTPDIAKAATTELTTLRSVIPGAVELVYDNYNALAIGFGPTDKTSEAIISLALYPKWIRLFFLQNGPSLPDPTKRLEGSGSKVRSVLLDSPATLDEPDVRALLAHALRTATRPIDAANTATIVIKSISAKQRPRR